MESARSAGFAGAAGVAAGCTSMMANAAGPIMIIYMLSMRMEKKALIGTPACFFWIPNLSKTPFSGNLNLIIRETLRTNALLLPLILTGSLAGIFLAHRLPQRRFNRILETLTACAALYLVGKPLLA